MGQRIRIEQIPRVVVIGMVPLEALSPNLRDRVLSGLGFSHAPAADVDGLQAVYDAWCHHIPFDNLRKLIHVHSQNPSPLPGSDSIDFFESWLKHRTGGTCWAGNGALYALLCSLGFTATRAVGTMLVAPELPPNHGTVLIEVENMQYLADASILHVVPIQLSSCADRKIPFNIKIEQRDDELWYVRWKPFNHLNGLDCRIDYHPASSDEFQQRHEQTRAWSPFNYQLTVRTMLGDCAVGTMNSHWFEQSNTGDTKQREISNEQRSALLINTIGYSEEIVSCLPADRPTPPPPGSKKAANSVKVE